MTSLALRAYLSGNITSSAAVCGEAHLDKRIANYVHLFKRVGGSASHIYKMNILKLWHRIKA